MKVMQCDRCGRLIEDSHWVVRVTSSLSSMITLSRDLCDECRDEFFDKFLKVESIDEPRFTKGGKVSIETSEVRYG